MVPVLCLSWQPELGRTLTCTISTAMALTATSPGRAQRLIQPEICMGQHPKVANTTAAPFTDSFCTDVSCGKLTRGVPLGDAEENSLSSQLLQNRDYTHLSSQRGFE